MIEREWAVLDNLEKVEELQILRHVNGFRDYLLFNDRFHDYIRHVFNLHSRDSPLGWNVINITDYNSELPSKVWLCPICYKIFSRFRYLASEDAIVEVYRMLKEK